MGYTIKKTSNPEATGWLHQADFYIKDKKVMSITFNDIMIINEDYYNATQGELSSENISTFLKSIDSSYA